MAISINNTGSITDYMKKGVDYVTAGQKSGTTLGTKATAEGSDTTASGEGVHAEGYMTKATMPYAHSEGYYATASGHYSHAEGYSTTASGSESHAEGMYSTASGDYSHAEGRSTEARGYGSHAEGISTYAGGQYAHAEGSGTRATGEESHAEGYNTTAQRKSQHVFGEYNVLDTGGTDTGTRGTYVEIVGNGTDADNRSNARTLDWDGNEVLAGKLTVGAAPTNNMDVATKQYVDTEVKIFVAVYGTTTGMEIQSALLAGKTIICRVNSVLTVPMLTGGSAGVTPEFVFRVIDGIGDGGTAVYATDYIVTGSTWTTTTTTIIPTQAGNSGKYLTTNGSTMNWDTVASGTTITYGDTDLTAGTSSLDTGTFYAYYE